MAAIRSSVSFVGLDWAAEDEKLRARVNRRKEKKRSRCRRKIEQCKMSKDHQLQVKSFLLHVTLINDEQLRTICAVDSCETFLNLMEARNSSIAITTDRAKINFYHCIFDYWKESDVLFPKAFDWMTDAIQQLLYSHPATTTTSHDRSTSTISSSLSNNQHSAVGEGSSLGGVSVEHGMAMSFRSLIDVVGAEKFIGIEKEAKHHMSTTDGWMESESTILGFLNLMSGKEMENALIQQPEEVMAIHDEMITWFASHQHNLEKRLWFLCEIFQQHRTNILLADASSSDHVGPQSTAQNSAILS